MNLQEKLAQHNMVVKGPLTHPFESMHMGNGDIGASVNIYPHEIKIVLAKSDVWDARSNADPEKYALKHDDLIRLMAEKDRDLFNIWDVGKGNEDYIIDCYTEDNRRMPEPKRAGCIRLFHPGLSDTYVESTLQLVDGVIVCTFHFAKGKLIVRAFVEKGENRVWMHVTAEGEAPWVVFIVEKEPDDFRAEIPLPVVKDEGQRLASISQTIPAGFGIDEFHWTLAAKFPDKGQWLEYRAYRIRQFCQLADGESAALCVAIATDRDGIGNTRQRALKLATEHADYQAVFANHQANWMAFWNRSNIELADKELESVWYRNHFGFACALGANPLGSAGNVLIQDSIPWNGDCHTNHNFQKWYCTAYTTNHAEWMALYARFIREKLPIFEYQAQLVFGLEGAYVDISYFPFMVKEHSNIINHMGRALAVTGWMAAPLWHHYEYFKDVDWLRKNTYPFLKAAATFYVNYMEKYSDETGEIFPSIRLEEPHWTKDFIGCRNVLTDLCMFKKTFERAIAAAEVLGVDEDLRQVWAKTAARVADIEYGEDWIALDKHWPEVEPVRRADESRYSRWGGGGWIVYPGEYVQGDEADGITKTLRTMLSKTDPMNPYISEQTGENVYPGVPVIHPISSLVPMIRLGLKDKFSRIREVLLAHRLTYGQAASYMLSGGSIPEEVNSSLGFLWYDWRSVENKYAGVLAINEMLLQSQGGVVRLFPFLPDDMDAAFNNFRAIGGFVISAQRKNSVTTAEILSELGEDLQYKLPDGQIKRIPTEAGKVYHITF